MSISEVRTSVVTTDPVTGEVHTWDDLLERIDDSDIIILGEQHDDHVGHLVQLAIVEDVAGKHPGTIVGMEMLERDEQMLVDDYRDGLVNSDDFTRMTFSGKWAGEGSWEAWYLPIIDAAHERGGIVIAANAPRRYVRTARRDGFDRLAELPDDRQQLVAWPDPPIEGEYRERFMDLMNDHGEDEVDVEVAESFFRSQQVWDATMAETIAVHHPMNGKSILLVGQFHSDHGGGTVQMLRRHLPDATLLVISLGVEDDSDLPEAETPRADLVIKAAARP